MYAAFYSFINPAINLRKKYFTIDKYCKPINDMKFMWIIFALSAALTAAIVVVLSKAGIKNMDSSLAFALQAILILIVSWSVVFFQGKHTELVKIEPKTWAFLAIAGVLTALSSLLSFRALKLGDASVVSPIERLSLVFAIVFAAFFLKERVSWQIVIGAVLMIAGAVLIAVAKKAA
ncbi:MAG: EamA family transporter [Ferruginibacter sp.]